MKKKTLCKKISSCVARLNPRNKKWFSNINYGKLPCAGPAFVAFPLSILEEEPHSSPDVTESCWHVNARANARDVFCLFFVCVLCFFLFFFFFFAPNKASTYGLSPIVLLNSLPVKKKLKTDSKPRSVI